MKMNANINNNDLDPCLDEQEIRTHASGEDTGVRNRNIVRSHRNISDACQEPLDCTTEHPNSLENLITQSVQIFRDKYEQLRQATKRGPIPGTIWRARPNPDEKDELIGPLVLVLNSEDTPDGQLLSVVEVSDALDQATDSDILILPQGSGLSLPSIIRTENAFRMRREWLHSFASELVEPLWQNVRVLITERQQVQHHDLPVPGTDPRYDLLQAAIRKYGYLAAKAFPTTPAEDLSTLNEGRLPNKQPNISSTSAPEAYEEPERKESSRRSAVDAMFTKFNDLLDKMTSLLPTRAKRALDEYSCYLDLAEETSRGDRSRHESKHYMVGDPIQFCVTPAADGYLAIFHHNAQGQISLVFPNYYDRDTFVNGGMEQSVGCRVKGPTGNQFFTAIWTSQQLLDSNRLVLDVPDVLSANQHEIETFLAEVSRLGADDFDEVVWEFTVSDGTKDGNFAG
jgi:hypothetical protein